MYIAVGKRLIRPRYRQNACPAKVSSFPSLAVDDAGFEMHDTVLQMNQAVKTPLKGFVSCSLWFPEPIR